jgi:predicted MFS family arabinose efflux permease
VGTLLLLAIGQGQIVAIVLLALWGISYGVTQLSQLTMTQAAAPETFEAAMSLNTMAYNTSIAVGALVGGLLVDSLGVSSVVWFGAALTAVALLIVLGIPRTTSGELAKRG